MFISYLASGVYYGLNRCLLNELFKKLFIHREVFVHVFFLKGLLPDK